METRHIGLLNLKRQHENLEPELTQTIQQVISDSAFIGGKYKAQFESDWASYVGTRHCVGVGSGTDAIRIALEAAGIGGEVIVPVNTAYPTAEAVIQAGCVPVFADCDYDYLIDIDHAKVLVTDKTEAIIFVHLYGYSCYPGDIGDFYDLFIIEDCAHAHGAIVGFGGNVAAWSFNPTKILGALGDAGAITTHDDKIETMVRRLADHGRKEKYEHRFVGHNSRLDGLQAAILSLKLKYLDKWTAHRQKIARLYLEKLAYLHKRGYIISLPFNVVDYPCVFHQFVIRIPQRDRVHAELAKRGIETGIHYPRILTEQPALKYLGYRPEDTPRALEYSRQILSLPISESISPIEVSFVCRNLTEILESL